MIKRITVSILLFFSSIAWTGDHLEPVDSIYSWGGVRDTAYEDQLLRYFSGLYRDDVLLRLIVIPSFLPEYALTVQKEGENYFVFYQSPKQHLWNYQMELPFKLNQLDKFKEEGVITSEVYQNRLNDIRRKYPENPMDVPKASCRKEINKKLVLDIQFVWLEMLLQTKYSRKYGNGFDGETYIFSAPMIDGGIVQYVGQVWSPEPKTKTGQLVEISDLMVDYCLKPDEDRIAKLLAKKVKKLKDRI